VHIILYFSVFKESDNARLNQPSPEAGDLDITVSEEQLKMVVDRLDTVKLKIPWLRLKLLPEEEATE
jgi:hypothetical protein